MVYTYLGLIFKALVIILFSIGVWYGMYGLQTTYLVSLMIL